MNRRWKQLSVSYLFVQRFQHFNHLRNSSLRRKQIKIMTQLVGRQKDRIFFIHISIIAASDSSSALLKITPMYTDRRARITSLFYRSKKNEKQPIWRKYSLFSNVFYSSIYMNVLCVVRIVCVILILNSIWSPKYLFRWRRLRIIYARLTALQLIPISFNRSCS